jgi:hypothetical protein
MDVPTPHRMPGRRYFEYSTIGGNILYDIIKNRELSSHDEEMKNNPYVKLKRVSDTELIAKTRSHRKELLAQVPFVYGDSAVYAVRKF